MDALTAIATARAIRRYTDEPISSTDLATILFAASRAPSGSNRQPFRFIVLRESAQEARALLATAAAQLWDAKRVTDRYSNDGDSPKARMARTMDHYTATIAQAPVIVLGCLVRYRDPNPYEGASIYPACQNLLLAARALGIGGVLTQLHGLVEPDLRAVLGIPEGVAMHATITLGHPVGHHGPVRRRPLAELVYEDRWEQPAPWAVDPPGTQYTAAGPSPTEPSQK